MGLLGIDGIEQETILGRGAFGIVYKAWQPALQRPVAVKILVGAFDPVALRRFERECATIGSLSEEPGILTVYTAGHTPEGSPYLVMPYLAGGSLADRLHHGPLPTPEATAHGIAIARALAAAHDHGVLHLDIKPANILLDTQGRPHLADFGIARFIDTEQRGHTATVAGTPGFAAPEIFDGRQPSIRSDIYGLGATLHALAAGRTPFSLSAAGGLSGLLHQIAHQDPPDLRPHGVPDAYARIVERAMAKDPDDRYPTMAHLATALTQLTPTTHTPTPTTSPPPPDDLDPPTLDEHQLPPTPHPPPPRPPWLRRAAVAAAAVVGVALVAVVAVVLTGGDDDGRPVEQLGPPASESDQSGRLESWLVAIRDVDDRLFLASPDDFPSVCRDGLDQVEDEFGPATFGAQHLIPEQLVPAIAVQGEAARPLWVELVDASTRRLRDCAARDLSAEQDAELRGRIEEARRALDQVLRDDGAGS